MASTNAQRYLEIGSLLVYCADLGILVCKQCQFAIQPNAVNSHLLRHRIYRKHREDLLRQLQYCKLLQPEEVPVPDDVALPFPYLSILQGRQCRIESCRHLCISIKRMNLHFRQQHSHLTDLNVENDSVEVRLQTFFRGNRIRYFRVAEDLASGDAPSDNAGHGNPKDEDMLQHQPALKLPVRTVNTQDLLYFHHYITVASSAMVRGPEPASFWTLELPGHAEKHQFLMYGMLGVAAYHKHLECQNNDDRRIHKEACLQYQSTGVQMFRGLLSHPPRGTHLALIAFARLLGAQHGVNYILDSRTQDIAQCDLPGLSPILEYINMFRGGVELLVDAQSILELDSPLRIPPYILDGLANIEIPLTDVSHAQVSYINNFYSMLMKNSHFGDSPRSLKFLRNCSEVRLFVAFCLEAYNMETTACITNEWVRERIPSSVTAVISIGTITGQVQILPKWRPASLSPCPPLQCYPDIPSAVYFHLSSLPELLRNELQMPSKDELEAFDQGMALLVSCYARSYAADATWARWNGIETWTRWLPQSCLQLLTQGHPWILILVAHWCMLIARQEGEYFHLRGQSHRLVNTLMANMNAVGGALLQKCITLLSDLL